MDSPAVKYSFPSAGSTGSTSASNWVIEKLTTLSHPIDKEKEKAFAFSVVVDQAARRSTRQANFSRSVQRSLLHAGRLWASCRIS
jgi:hypothetical protein